MKREREGESLFSLRERKRVELGFADWVRARVSNSIDEKVKNFSYHACNYCVFLKKKKILVFEFVVIICYQF